jgi:hypothetical protein
MIKRPRQYAAEILALPTAEERKALFDLVPDIWKPMTKDHVWSEWERRKHDHMARKNRPRHRYR